MAKKHQMSATDMNRIEEKLWTAMITNIQLKNKYNDCDYGIILLGLNCEDTNPLGGADQDEIPFDEFVVDQS